jgi:hypothetical protein
MAGGGVGEAMLISAAVGGATSAATGGDPLKGALLGAATGGAFHGLAGPATAASGSAAPAAAAPVTPAASGVLNPAGQMTSSMVPSVSSAGAGGGASGIGVLNPAGQMTSSMVPSVSSAGIGGGASTTGAAAQTAGNPMFPELSKFYANNPMTSRIGAGIAGSALGDTARDKEDDEYRGALSDFRYSRSGYTPYRIASGGLMDTAVARRMAGGGHLGAYSDGGQLLKGREADSNGMKDDIPASIEGAQPALLADGEFVIPADVVSGLGNGSTEAGARQLYDMMEKVREARTGRSRQAPEIDADRMMPA